MTEPASLLPMARSVIYYTWAGSFQGRLTHIQDVGRFFTKLSFIKLYSLPMWQWFQGSRIWVYGILICQDILFLGNYL